MGFIVAVAPSAAFVLRKDLSFRVSKCSQIQLFTFSWS